MLSLDQDKLLKTSIPIATGWLLGDCMESKGKQDLWIRQKPEVLEALREQAVIQSAESSNRIEGVTIAPDRLRPVVLGKSNPRDRSEEEVAGYRKALDWIYSRRRPVPIEAATILHLHALAQGGFSGDAGQWKAKDNEIIEIMPDGSSRIRFRATSAKETPGAVKQLCFNYSTIEHERIPLLISLATFVFDFLCIHPFRDGNGRVSRLLTALLLQQHGFVVSQYISLERLVEESKEDYYRTLKDCSRGWHEGSNELALWWNYFLSILRRAYVEFSRQVESTSSEPAKGRMVRQEIESQIGPFTLAELKAQCPAASVQLIKKILAQMKKAGLVRLVGRGRGAYWENVRGK